MSPEQVAVARANIRSSLDGGAPAGQTYQQWLKRQPKEFQDDVLGPTKAALFRDGELSLDKFVDMRSGKPFDLAALKARESEAWAAAVSP